MDTAGLVGDAIGLDLSLGEDGTYAVEILATAADAVIEHDSDENIKKTITHSVIAIKE